MNSGAWILLVAVVGALAFGLHRGRVDGRFAGSRGDGPAATLPVEVAPAASDAAALLAEQGIALGEKATLVQFSSAFCAPCRVTRRTLGEVADVVPGVAHVEIDAEEHLEATRRLEILRTPTTIVLDAAGREVSRAVGAPRKDQVLAALATAVED